MRAFTKDTAVKTNTHTNQSFILSSFPVSLVKHAQPPPHSLVSLSLRLLCVTTEEVGQHVDSVFAFYCFKLIS